MTRTETRVPVSRSIHVHCDLETAFRVFTRGIAS